MEFQPESVVGEMREYQLEGLKWLVARFDDGINTILADEMVRVAAWRGQCSSRRLGLRCSPLVRTR